MFSFIDGILHKFAKEELEFEINIKTLETKREHIYRSLGNQEVVNLEHSEPLKLMRQRAKQRNRTLLKELEVEIAKLRSRACFCPTDTNLSALRRRYALELRRV